MVRVRRLKIAPLSVGKRPTPEKRSHTSRKDVAPDAVLEEYLYRFRPGGQYDAIRNSASNLRKT